MAKNPLWDLPSKKIIANFHSANLHLWVIFISQENVLFQEDS